MVKQIALNPREDKWYSKLFFIQADELPLADLL